MAGMASSNQESPDHSSPESFEVEDDSSLQTSSAQWPVPGQTSPDGTTTSPSQPTRTAPPMQKRRRVTRACDECRRKKIKCDGKQPCTHCTVYSYDCTYDQPSNRRRNPAPQYIEALENRLQRAEALLRTFIPNIDIKDPNFDSLLHQRQASLGMASSISDFRKSDVATGESQEASQNDAHLRSMIESTGQLDLDERGDWDFHGGSSGAVFLRRMREQFGGLLGGDAKAPFLPRPPRPSRPKSSFDSPKSMDSPFDTGLPNTSDLPSRESALILCHCSMTRACALLRFVHVPTFYEMFDRIYETAPENFTDDENRFLPLLYVVLALGCLFTDHIQETQRADELDYKAGIEQGYKYFRAARSIMEITECRDITSLQAILFMILFLQSSSNLSTCYSYIGVALRSAVRMGMHRNLIGNFNPIERETRRRVFWVIRKMDTYVAALLGFPKMLGDEDIDQVLPLEIDDEYITKDAILEMPSDKLSVYVACNAHTRLMGILAKVIKYIYPIKGIEQSIQPTSSSTYVVSHAKIREIEGDLKNWLDKLPMALRPSEDESEEVVRVQQLLRMAYAHVQMMLYRPFLHYISGKCSNNKSLCEERSYACAAAAVSVSRNIVHITVEMKRRGVLIGAYWFTMYTTFFAILSLAFFVTENPDKPGSQEIFKDAIAGKDALQGLARRSQAADRCNTALNMLFEKLPEKLKRGQVEPKLPKKKRSASSLNPVIKQESRSNPDIQTSLSSTSNVQRATTFPTRIDTTPTTRQSASFDNSRHPSSAAPDSKWRRSFQDIVSPNDISGTGTPDSAASSSNGTHNQANLQQPFGDLGAMMFPSSDPFAYPNQAMMSFDHLQQKPGFVGSSINTSASNMFMANVGGPHVSSPYDNLEGQLFGPLPPYLMHTQPGVEMTNMDMSGVPGFNPQEMRGHTGLTPGVGGNVNFEDIFAGGNEEWNNMLGDQVYMQ